MKEANVEGTNLTKHKIENAKPKTTILSKLTSALNSGKLKDIKGAKIILPMVMLALVVLMYMGLTSSNSKTTSVLKDNQTTNSVNFTSGLDYIQQIEKRLEKILGSIKNAGETKVMISISGSPELEIAKNVEEKTVTTTNGTTVTVVTEPILVDVNGEEVPVVLKESLPQITGVIVVSAGAGDAKVKLDIITAIKALLDIPSGSIEVFAGV